MEPSPQPANTPSATEILTESKTIIMASYSHFMTLALFFLPLSITLILSPTVEIPEHFSTLDHKTIIIYILIMIMVYILTICGIAAVTYSTHQRFINNQVHLLTVLNSLTCNFLPLSYTAIILLISLTWFVFVGLILIHLLKLGFAVDFSVVYIILGVILSVIMMCLHVNWSLACVVMVVESKWVFSALMRSIYLVKGMKFVSMLIMLTFCSYGFGTVWAFSDYYGVMNKWIRVFFRAFGTFYMMFFCLWFSSVNTVLYKYCRVLRGESVITDVVEEFGCDYVDLPSDVENVPRGGNAFPGLIMIMVVTLLFSAIDLCK